MTSFLIHSAAVAQPLLWRKSSNVDGLGLTSHTSQSIWYSAGFVTALRDQLSPYEIVGAPYDLASAEALKEISPYQFEWWAVDLVNARPAKDHKKGADTGIDGYINFFDDKSGQAKQVIVQVKSGYIGVNHVRDLKGVLEREKAPIGVLITLREPTKPMLTEAAARGLLRIERLPRPLSAYPNSHHCRTSGRQENAIPRAPRRDVCQSGAENKEPTGRPFLGNSGQGASWSTS